MRGVEVDDLRPLRQPTLPVQLGQQPQPDRRRRPDGQQRAAQAGARHVGQEALVDRRLAVAQSEEAEARVGGDRARLARPHVHIARERVDWQGAARRERSVHGTQAGGPAHGTQAGRALFESAGHSLATRLRPSYRPSLRATCAVRISEPPSMLPHSSQKVTLARCCSSCASSTARTSCGRMCVCGYPLSMNDAFAASSGSILG
jgi:hypothetical protein